MPTSHLDYITCEPFRSWNRLEPRPRKHEFEDSLKAAIHDSLWMLTRQWQFGEFKGEDTGSAVFAKIQIETTRITRFQNRETVPVAYDERIPLEARVERLPVSYDLRFRARAGQHWLRLLKHYGELYNAGAPGVLYNHTSFQQLFASAYAMDLPVLDRESDSTAMQIAKARVLSNKLAHQAFTGLSGRTPDGVAWYEDLKSGGMPLILPSELTSSADYDSSFEAFMLVASGKFIEWFENSHEVPQSPTDTSWAPSNLEYSFACSMPNKGAEKNSVLQAKEYYQGSLDWHSFNLELSDDGSGLADKDPAEELSNVKTEVFTFIPSEARFAGMPNSRWWEFEDGSTDLGNITAETTNLAKILLAEFALMYSNDWFVIPYSVPAGSLSEVKGIIITDSFGQRTLIEPAAQGDANDWTSWTMFNLSKTSSSEGLTGKTDPRIFIPPVVSKVHESKPLESVEIVRDEMANMVWGVENIIPDLVGGGQDGNAAAQEMSNWLRNLDRGTEEVIVSAIPDNVKLKFNLGNTVPENWIPFLPVHTPGQNRAIQLQRASMPRWYNNEFSQVRPRTEILRQGMSEDDSSQDTLFVNPSDEDQNTSYFLYEEEAPRSGVLVEGTWQRARWYNGKIVCWFGRRKKVARGEGASGLAFDQVIDVDYEGRQALVPADNE